MISDGRTKEEAALGLLSPALTAPLSPEEQMKEKYGTGGTLLRMLGVGLSGGLLGNALLPEMGRGARAKHAIEVELYNEELKRQGAAEQAAVYEGLLSDDDESNDLKAIRMGALQQPEIYGPVLRDMLQNQYNPTEETMFAPDYQLNPESNRWEMVQTGNQGTTNRTEMPEGFVPTNRMLSPEAREKAIGEFDQSAFDSTQRLDNIKNLEANMDEIGEDAWTAGLRGEVSEKWKQVTGTEDPVSMARKQYEGIRTSKAVQNLPPGVASDKDIELVLAPFPTRFTNYEQLREYIAGLRRGEEKIREYNQFGARYLSRPGGGSRRGMAEAWDSHWQEQTSKGGKFYAEEDQQSGTSLEDEFNNLWGD